MQETQVQSLGREDPPEKGMANHSSILPRRIPWTEAPGRPHSTGSQRVRHDWATDTTTLEPEPSISLQRISSLRDPPALYLQLWSQAWELPLEQPWQVQPGRFRTSPCARELGTQQILESYTWNPIHFWCGKYNVLPWYNISPKNTVSAVLLI